MCLTDIDGAIKELEALKVAREYRAKFDVATSENTVAWTADDRVLIDLSVSEARTILDARIAGIEASIRRMGFTGKVVAVEAGESQRVMHSR